MLRIVRLHRGLSLDAYGAAHAAGHMILKFSYIKYVMNKKCYYTVNVSVIVVALSLRHLMKAVIY